MPEPSTYRPATGSIPTSAGVYKFRDPDRRVIYVGKAKNLRNRLNSYFANPAALHPRTSTMVHTANSVEWTVVDTEVEALQLEWTWINEFNPRFNVMFRDDKSYPYLAITMNDEVPRAFITRGKRRKGVKYFGPFAQVWAIKDTLDLLLRAFPMRTCTAGVYRRAERSGRPCLLGYIDKCAAPCVGQISKGDHKDLARSISDFMSGNTGRFISHRQKEMASAAAELDYERAARLRDEISALQKVLDKSAVVLSVSADCDIFALVTEELEASVQVFHVRQGRIRGQRGWIIERSDDHTPAELTTDYLRQAYSGLDADAIPKEILVDTLPADLDSLEAWLSQQRGSRVTVRVPERGEKKAALETVGKNAKEALVQHKLKRSSDLTTRSQALKEIQEHLDLAEAPLRIECIDISHTQGSNVVASLVVFEDGMAKKRDYRHFAIHGDAAADDTASMYDVVSRRFSRYLEQMTSEEPDERFGYRPSLLVVDGAGPQVAAATRALTDLGIVDISVVGLAKRLEEIWVPDDPFPVILPRNSEGLFLMQRLRDEAHRFAITYHRSKRAKAMTSSVLDEIPGLGESKRTALLRHFGSVKKVRAATAEEICEVKGIGPALAAKIVGALTD
ncbi:excinuclease ABC subunit UvrC [Brevibacterium linens]|uniref:UvrABC system protein C n=2 Tax=Brevibacterium linens TaxID=1703 RepID=A0A2H1HNA1_BRELN|nr:excinuclease ABC subunit UvrC [Brevibacterium linens]AZU00879.1 excinuclease ABC subunit UvrC [Brevibacterium linens]KAB1949607.1 excinuclease ABC subunit UvrC [Brevibacterium linens ATCC 9172]SMX63614.1 Excinuclease ABC subunit C [Brevibacterium linens ATCC 9172]SMX64407.1 Excinuclease ABC subunit C [Brevibacterium linens]